ncbi:MAG TPA: hypothetical protein VF077_09780 [Nitrospiraceae bacterium]
MNEADFHMVTQQLLMVGNLVKDLKLSEYINAINRADSIAPIIDPTLWKKGHQKTAILQKMARGLMMFQESLPTEEEARKADLAAEW